MCTWSGKLSIGMSARLSTLISATVLDYLHITVREISKCSLLIEIRSCIATANVLSLEQICKSEGGSCGVESSN